MYKELPYSISPICAMGNHTIALNILDNYQTVDMKTWFINSLINMDACVWFNRIFLRFSNEFNDNEFKNCPLLSKYFIPVSTVKSKNIDIVQLIQDMINCDYYTGFLCDRFYLNFCSDHFQKNHFTHFALIIGYDTEAETFIIADYFREKYSIQKASFSEVRDSFVLNTHISDMPFEDSIICVKYQESKYSYITYQKARIIYLVERYLAGDVYPDVELWEGVSIYDALRLCVDRGHIQNSVLQAIYDHKLAMQKRMYYMDELGLLKFNQEEKDQYQDAVLKANQLRNYLLKYEISPKKPSIDQVYQKINEYKEYDILFMNKFLNKLKES